MCRYRFVRGLSVSLVLAVLLSACSWLDRAFPDRSQEYKKAKTTKALDIPPDLTATTVTDALIVPSGSTTLSGYTSARQTIDDRGSSEPVLPGQDGLVVKRDRDRSWLVVQGEPSAVWPRVREFWLQNGFLIMREDPATGILETNWVENRANIPLGPVRSLLGRVFESAYSSSYRDRYRMRLERGEQSGTTEVFITHQGVEEIVTSNDTGTTKWAPRAKDPGLESEKLKQLMLYLGVQPELAQQKLTTPETNAAERAELILLEGAQPVLVVRDTYDNAWRSVGLVLDRVDFAVEDRDRAQGLYDVRYNDPLEGHNEKGRLSKLAFWSKKQKPAENYKIKLSDGGADTHVTVLNALSEPETSNTAVHILKLLYEELR